MAKTIFEEMGGTYRQVGDYFIPNLVIPAEEEHKPIDIWGELHGRFFKEHQQMLDMNLLTSGKLNNTFCRT